MTIIEQIHNDFLNEVENIAEVSKDYDLPVKGMDIIQKAERLKKLGFIASKECDQAKIAAPEVQKQIEENKYKKNVTEAIQYFGFKYPFNKFITETSVIKICAKYGLVYGPVSNYTDTVPDKNLKEIENFIIHPDDKCCIYTEYIFHVYSVHEIINKVFISHTEALTKEINPWDITKDSQKCSDFEICPFEIVAPVGNFNLKRLQLQNYKLTKLPDPIVLQPVFFGGLKHYLILSAWGDEAKDVINEKFN